MSARPADERQVSCPEAVRVLQGEVERLRAERDEARQVAWLLWRDLRERELRGPSATRLARRHPWIERSDGEALE